MPDVVNDLLDAAGSIDEIQNDLHSAKLAIDMVRDRAEYVGRAHCGSWVGYHANVYHDDLTPPPAGAVFSVEWGLMNPAYHQGSAGDWRQYSFDEVRAGVLTDVSEEAWETSKTQVEAAREKFEDARRDIKSLLLASGHSSDVLIQEILEALEEVGLLSRQDILSGLNPGMPPMSRDSVAMSAGVKIPPHAHMFARAAELSTILRSAEQTARNARSAARHIRRLKASALGSSSSTEGGTRVFIAHGRSPLWRELKDFVESRLGLPWDEFNRQPAAGLPNTTRLSQMLESAQIALLVMTAEDTNSDGESRARMNVIHEVGLFQGRLGFTKAIVLMEEGCAEFSNIQGLGQIRFPAGNISAAFEEVRQVLEREGVIS